MSSYPQKTVHPWRASLIMLVLGLLLVGTGQVIAATFQVTSSSCTGPGSFVEAVNNANATPGTDTISFQAGLTVNAVSCPSNTWPAWITQVTESVNIEGNGAHFAGSISWITPSGGYNGGADCPTGRSYKGVMTSETPGFLEIGVLGADNSGISVTVQNLSMSEVNAIAQVNRRASLTLESVTADKVRGVYPCATPAIRTLGGDTDLTLRSVRFTRFLDYGEAANNVLLAGAIQGEGRLTIEDSVFQLFQNGGAINWGGAGPVNIVSSLFERTGGFLFQTAQANFVNSLWASSNFSMSDSDRVMAWLGTTQLDITASTLLFADAQCDADCRGNSLLQPGIGDGWLWTAGNIGFEQSVVGVNFPDVGPSKLLDTVGGQGSFSADEFTWIRPTVDQDASALRTLTNQPALLTGEPALRTIVLSGNGSEWGTPLYGNSTTPGVLIDIVPDAGAGGANELINPIDGSPILLDVLGNPRVDGNGRRNAGAIQLVLAPHLSVVATGDGSVDLSWTRPSDPPSGAVAGYEIRHRLVGSSTWSAPLIRNGPDTLTGTVTGLTNGTDYEFQVTPLIGASLTPGFEPSNIVTATPYGPLGQPTLTATAGPGSGQVQLNWTMPSLGGRQYLRTFLTWRENASGIAAGYQIITNPATVSQAITGLKNGIEYAFTVTVVTTDNSSTGPATATATPLAVPNLSYGTFTVYNGFFAPIVPTVTDLSTAIPSFTIVSGTLPDGMSLDPITGTVSGTPSGSNCLAQCALIIQLTQPGLGPNFSTTAPLNITQVDTTTPDLRVTYPDINTSANGAIVATTPTATGLLAGEVLTYSVLGSGDPLPSGFTLNTQTGVISGPASVSTAGVSSTDIGIASNQPGRQAASFVDIQILPTLSYVNGTFEIGDAVTVTPTVSTSSAVGDVYRIVSGGLPNGLSLDPDSGVISGTPTRGGDFSLLIERELTYSNQQTQTVNASLHIKVTDYTITLGYEVISMTAGKPVSAAPTVTDLKGSPTFALTQGTLPPGLTLDPDTGVISGLPSTPLKETVAQVTVTDTYTSAKAGVGFIVVIGMRDYEVSTLSPLSMALLALLLMLTGFVLHRRQTG